MSRAVLTLSILGALFVIILGSLLHFVYEWSGNSEVIGSLTPVNESTWEHLKLALIPILLFALIEWFVLRKQNKNIICATAVEIWLVILLITSLFYAYTGIIGFHTLWADILLAFVVPVIIGKYASYRMLIHENQPKSKIVPAISLLLLLFAFVLFTFSPPRIPLFRNPIDDTYGMYHVE